jgi:hypothetical protein
MSDWPPPIVRTELRNGWVLVTDVSELGFAHLQHPPTGMVVTIPYEHLEQGLAQLGMRRRPGRPSGRDKTIGEIVHAIWQDADAAHPHLRGESQQQRVAKRLGYADGAALSRALPVPWRELVTAVLEARATLKARAERGLDPAGWPMSHEETPFDT